MVDAEVARKKLEPFKSAKFFEVDCQLLLTRVVQYSNRGCKFFARHSTVVHYRVCTNTRRNKNIYVFFDDSSSPILTSFPCQALEDVNTPRPP